MTRRTLTACDVKMGVFYPFSDEGMTDDVSTYTYAELLALGERLRQDQSQIEVEAQERTIGELADGLRQTRAAVQRIADSWTQEQLQARPLAAGDAGDAAAVGEDRWSATEMVSHLIATQNWYMLQMGRLLGRREQFEVMPRGLGDHARADVAKEQLVTELGAATARLQGSIAAIPADADLTAQRDSHFFGALSLRGWIMLAIAHDLDHLAQMGRVAAEHGFAQVG